MPAPNFTPVTIAVTPLAATRGEGKVGAVLANDFAHSIFLTPLNPTTFPRTISNPDVRPNIDAWKTVNAQFVLTGRVARAGGGRLTAQFRLWDTATGEQVAGQQYSTDAANARRVAHLIADAVFSRVTGEKGFFDSRVVFVDETGSKEKRRKRLALMDMDGANVKYLTTGDKLVVTPRFSPSAAAGRLHVVRRRRSEGDAARSRERPAPAGRRFRRHDLLAALLARRRSTSSCRCPTARRRTSTRWTCGSHQTARLTDDSAIDTSPSYSPDGSQIVFESDRGGTQQLYVMSAGGGGAKRISFGDGRYSTPVWSPRGDLIAFTRQKDGQFGIGVMKTDGSGERIITEGYHNEGPTLLAQRAVRDVLPRSRRRGRRQDLHGRHFRPRRIPGADRRATPPTRRGDR